MFRSRILAVAFAAASLGGCDVVGNDDNRSALSDPAVQSCLRDTIEECYAQNLSPDDCASLIEDRCLGGMDDPPGDPNDPECRQRVFDDCVAAGVDEMTCYAIADDQCRDPSQPPDDEPPCTDPPGPDPMCVEQVRNDCLAQGVDPMTCEAYANQVCDPANGGGQDPGMPDPNMP